MIDRTPSITIEELSRGIKISTRSVEKHLASLKEKNIIKRIGPDKSGHWEIIKQDNP